MMRTFRKQTRQDFRGRVKRIDPKFYRMGDRAYAKDKTPRRRLLSVLTGFGWAYVVMAVATNKDQVAAALAQQGVPAVHHGTVFIGLAVLVAVSCVLIGVHGLRFMLHHGNRGRNSGGLLAGALAAVTLFHAPTALWQTGFGLMDNHSQTLLQTASTAIEKQFPGVGIGTLTFVSSSGR